MKNRYKRILILFIVLTIITLGYIFRIDRFGFSSIRWVDFIILDGYLYEGEYADKNNNHEDRIIVDPNLIGDRIGKVKFKIQGNVRNSNYIKRNLDASILNKGTEIYEIIDDDNRQRIAVKIGTEFNLYTKEE